MHTIDVTVQYTGLSLNFHLADQCEALGAVHVVQVCACEPQGEGKVLYPTQTLTLILTLSLALSLTLSLTLTLS